MMPSEDVDAHVQATATLLVRREPALWANRIRRFKVVLDGRTVGDIRPRETVTVVVEPGSHRLVIRIDWCSSNTIGFDVERGQVASFDCGSTSLFLTFLRVIFAPHTYLWLKENVAAKDDLRQARR